MKKLGEKSSPAADTSIKPLVFHNIRVVIITSHFHLVWLVWNFLLSYDGTITAGDLFVGTLIFVTLQAFVLSWSYLGGLSIRDSFAEFESSSEKKSSKRMSMAKSNFRKVAESWIVSWEFSVISIESSIWG